MFPFLKKTTLTLILGLLTFSSYAVDAGVQGGIPGEGQLSVASMNKISGNNPAEKAQTAAKSILSTFKVILNGAAVIFIVYAGIMMVVAYGDEWALTKQKQQLIYAMVAFLFVNIPGQLYNVFTAGREVKKLDVTANPSGPDFTAARRTGNNIFVNFDVWNSTIENGVLAFIKIAVIGLAVLFFTLAGFKLIVSGGNEEAKKKAKWQAIYGFLALIFLGVIQAWVSIAYSGDLPKGQGVFASLANLALFFAGPTAIFFIILGGWYYITSGGDEERAKQGKRIIVNTLIATIILLASYTFLRDLADFRL